MWLIRTPDDGSALIARIVLGAVMFPHGAQKVCGWFGGDGFYSTIEHMAEQMPPMLAVLVIAGELVASLGLLFGCVGRVAAAGIGFIMLGGILLVHLPHGFFMNWTGKQSGEGFEYHLLAIGLALVVVIRGSGAFSIDRALGSGAERVPHPACWPHVGVTAPDADSEPSPQA